MSNALTTAASGGALANSDMANPFAAAGAGAGSKIYMKFKGASGDFLYGADEDEIPHDTQFGADIMNSKWNWTFWWEGEVLETLESFVAESPMEYENEPDFLPEGYDGDMTLDEIRAEQADRKTNFMDGWSCQAVLEMRLVGGDVLNSPDHELEPGADFVIKMNNGVALGAFRTLLNTFGRQFKLKMGLIPIISISSRSYVSKNKSVGKRYTPVLKIVDWRSEDDLIEALGDDLGMYDDPAGTAGGDGAVSNKEAAAVIEDKAVAKAEAPAEKDAAIDDGAPAAARGRGRRGAANYA